MHSNTSGAHTRPWPAHLLYPVLPCARPALLALSCLQLYGISLRLARDIYETLDAFLTRHPPEVTFRVRTGGERAVRALPAVEGRGMHADRPVAGALAYSAAVCCCRRRCRWAVEARRLRSGFPAAGCRCATLRRCGMMAGA